MTRKIIVIEMLPADDDPLELIAYTIKVNAEDVPSGVFGMLKRPNGKDLFITQQAIEAAQEDMPAFKEMLKEYYI